MNTMSFPSSSSRGHRGFSLVELLVAVLIGLVATLVITQTFQFFEGRKRATTGGADVLTNGAVALYLMERDLRQAGYGMTPNQTEYAAGLGMLGQCTTLKAYYEDAASGDVRTITYAVEASPPTMPVFAPVEINPAGIPAGDTGSDVLMVTFTASNAMEGKDLADSPLVGAGGGSPYMKIKRQDQRVGFNVDDMALLVPSGLGQTCEVVRITSVPTDASSLDRLGYVGCIDGNACVDKPAGTYAAGSKVYNLGPRAGWVSRIYAIRSGNLTVCNYTTADCSLAANASNASIWTPIAYNIVGLMAEYGKDANRDGTIDAWQKTITWNTDATERSKEKFPYAMQLLAVRMALVARSPQYEKEEVTSAADDAAADQKLPVWRTTSEDGTEQKNVSVDVSAYRTDWQADKIWAHYRYKLVQANVSLRNMIWGQHK